MKNMVTEKIKSSRNFAAINCFSSGLLCTRSGELVILAGNFPLFLLFLPVSTPPEHCDQGAGEGGGDSDLVNTSLVPRLANM